MIEDRKVVRRRRAPNPHVVVRFDFGKTREIPYEPFDQNKLVYLDERLQAELKRAAPQISLRPLFRGLPVEAWKRMISIAEKADDSYREKRPNFFEYFDIVGPRNTDFCRIAAILNRYAEVRQAYVERLALGPQDQPFRWPAPTPERDWIGGIDVLAARRQMSTGGSVRFADVEEGWNLNHVQLPTAQLTLPPGEYNNPNEAGHGAAVLGIICAKEDDFGPEGIAPGAKGVTLCSVDQYGNPTHQAAIQKAGGQLQRGDVVVIEAQIYETSTSGRRVPVEALGDGTFWEIRTLIGNGIIVVEAGGNGDEWTGDPIDFDTYPDPVTGDPVLNLTFRDSEAIMVSAADMPAPPVLPYMARTPSAPYGARIDCFAWGNNVYTCWDDGTGANDRYIDNFPGTSAATAIVAGAVILLQDIAKTAHGAALTPQRMRQLLHDQVNTPCLAAPNIRRMPNLAALIPMLP